MTKTPLDVLRDRLALARVCLQESVPRTTPLIDRLLTIDQQLSDGKDQAARADLGAIITELGDVRGAPHAAADPANRLPQDPREELLPGVADAIVQLSKAVDLLI